MRNLSYRCLNSFLIKMEDKNMLNSSCSAALSQYGQ